MSAAPVAAPVAARILLVGRSPEVMETVLGELAGLGLAATGTTHPTEAASAFDARDFDLIAFGGGIEEPLRGALKRAFGEQNPAVRLLDCHAAVAARQIAAAIAGEAGAPEVDLEAYFARIGYAGSHRPDLDTLTAIHARHIDAIAFEGVDVWLGRGIDIAPAAVDAKLIGARRGGYCFEQSGLMKRSLTALGFAVEPLGARVLFGAQPGTPAGPRTHMVLRVTIEGTPYLVDAGFGRATPAIPLRLDTTDPQPTPHETCRVFPFGPGLLVQQQEADGRWQSLYQVTADIQSDADYAMANWFTSTHPSSVFVSNLVAARTTAHARIALLNGRLTIRGPNRAPEEVELDAKGLGEALTEHFGLAVEPSWQEGLQRAVATVF